MKIKSTKLIAMLLAVCMMFSFSSVAFAKVVDEKETINYVSIGDSMANGYCFDGYEQGNGDNIKFLEGKGVYGEGAYPNQFENWLETEYDLNVEHTKLALSAERAEDLLYLLGGRTEPNDGWQNQVNGYAEVYDDAVLSKFFTEAVKEADIITMGIGNASFGAFMLHRVTDALGVFGASLDEDEMVDLELALATLDLDEEQKQLVLDTYDEMYAELVSKVPAEYVEQFNFEHVCDIVAYTVAGFLVNFTGALERILELNPDVEIILVGLLNTTYGMKITMGEGIAPIEIGDMMDNVFGMLNAYIAAVGTYYGGIEFEEDKTANIYFAKQPDPKFICQVFAELKENGWKKIQNDRLSGEIVRERNITAYNDSLREMIAAAFSAVFNFELNLPKIDLAAVKAYEKNPPAWALAGPMHGNQYGFTGHGDDNKNLSIAIYLGIEDAVADSCDTMDIPLTGLKKIAGDLSSVFSGMEIKADDPESTPESIRGDLAEYLTSTDEFKGMCKIYALFKVGNGMSVHPTPEGHDEIFASVVEAYESNHTVQDETLENLEYLVKEYYDEAYAYAYQKAVAEGYIASAEAGLDAAITAVGEAKAYLENYVFEGEFEAAYNELLNELDAVAETLVQLKADIASGAFAELNETALNALLSYEDDLNTHLDNIAALSVSFGSAVADVVTPYITAANDAVNAYAVLVNNIVIDTFEWVITNVEDAQNAYLAWVEEIGQKVDVIDAELGQIVRDYLANTPAEACALIAAYGEEAVVKLIADAVAASGDIKLAVLNLASTLTVYGETIWNAVKDNDEVNALIADIKTQLANAKAAIEWMETYYTSATLEAIALKEEALNIAYGQLVYLYGRLYEVAVSVIDENDEEAAAAFAAAYDALLEVLTIAGDAAEGYHTWLVEHIDALGADLLALLLSNTCDFLHDAGEVIDRLIWNLLGKIDEAIRDHVSEKFEELKEKLIAYGIDLSKDLEPQIMALLETIAEDYDRCLYNATHAEYCICGGTHNYVALGGKLTAGDSYADLFAAALEAESADSVVNPIDAVYSDDTVLLTAENLVSYVESKKEAIAEADIITYNMDAADTITVLMNAMEGGYVDWSKYANAETLAIAEKVMAEVYARLAEKYDAAMLEAIDPIAEILVYAAVTYGVENIKALETITTINSDALVVVIGMVNPFAGVTIDYVGQKIDLGELFDYAIEATDLYNELYAMLTGKVTFVSAAGAETVTAAEPLNIVVSKDPSEFGIGDIEELTKLMEQIEYLLSGAGAYLTADGHAEVCEALLEAIALDGEHNYGEWVVVKEAAIGVTGLKTRECADCHFVDEEVIPALEPETPELPEINPPVVEDHHFWCDGGANCHCRDYEDLDNTMWYHQGVCYMIEHGYMIGIGDGKWAPEQIITRAEIATILWRIAGSEVVDYAMDFSDVEADMWYTEAIRWAVSEEIFLGYGDGKFGPNDQITREQMVTVMYRYELDNGKKITADFDMTTVSDAEEIGEWAVEAMTWALDCGLIIGTDVDVLTASPLKTATRAEVAMIFYRKLDNLLK